MAYVLFVIVAKGFYGSYAGGLASFQYEFKDKIQCENALKVMEKRFDHGTSYFNGYCQEVKK